MVLLALNPWAFKRFCTVLVEMCRYGSQCRFKAVLVENGFRRTSRCSALSSRCDVTRGRPERGRSWTWLVRWCFRTSRLITV